MNEVEKHASDNISRILVGNKSDMEESRQVSTDEGKELAEHYNVRFLETSAKDCKNVEEAFTMMTREIKSRVAITQPKRATECKFHSLSKTCRSTHSQLIFGMRGLASISEIFSESDNLILINECLET